MEANKTKEGLPTPISGIESPSAVISRTSGALKYSVYFLALDLDDGNLPLFHLDFSLIAAVKNFLNRLDLPGCHPDCRSDFRFHFHFRHSESSHFRSDFEIEALFRYTVSSFYKRLAGQKMRRKW